ncbi:Depupylase, partial [Geodia barretti]
RKIPFVELKSDLIIYNGSRFYNDHTHPEYSTGECVRLFELVAQDKAGERIVDICAQRRTEMLDRGVVRMYKNNTDFEGHSYGCHENYLMDRSVPFERILEGLLPFFATRQIFCGAGKVGVERDDRAPIYQLSQRAEFFEVIASVDTMHKRPVVNTRDEPHADAARYRRLHVIVGDSNMSEYATALKVGTTAMVLNLLERKIFPQDMGLGDPVWALKEISRDPTHKWILDRQNGRTISAIDIQRSYLDLAQRHLRGLDEESDWVLYEWERTLDDLESDPMQLTDRVDWVAKKWLLDAFRESENLSWDDPWLQSLDLEYHNIDPNRGLYFDLVQQGKMQRVLTDERVERACGTPPADTRAKARAAMVRTLSKNRVRYIVDWDSVYLENEFHLSLRDPFDTYDKEVEAFDEEVEVVSKMMGLRRSGK